MSKPDNLLSPELGISARAPFFTHRVCTLWLILFFAFALAGMISVAPWGSEVLLMFLPILAIPLLMFLFYRTVAGVVDLFSTAYRIRGLCRIGQVVITLLLIAIGARLSHWLRLRAFDEVAERGQPLALAIERWQADKGAPPESLEVLVPDYIPSIPGTGMGAYPEFIYFTDVRRSWPSRDWLLMVPVSGGVMQFDRFVYLPDRELAPNSRRFGDWLYLND